LEACNTLPDLSIVGTHLCKTVNHILELALKRLVILARLTSQQFRSLQELLHLQAVLLDQSAKLPLLLLTLLPFIYQLLRSTLSAHMLFAHRPSQVALDFCGSAQVCTY
jgi:hypothetical protein